MNCSFGVCACFIYVMLFRLHAGVAVEEKSDLVMFTARGRSIFLSPGL